jgi:hypothetical protein
LGKEYRSFSYVIEITGELADILNFDIQRLWITVFIHPPLEAIGKTTE